MYSFTFKLSFERFILMNMISNIEHINDLKVGELVFLNIMRPRGRWAPAIVRPSGLSFFHARYSFFHIHSSLLTSVLCFVGLLLNSCCSHAHMCGKHSCMSSQFPIAKLNRNLFFSRNEMVF